MNRIGTFRGQFSEPSEFQPCCLFKEGSTVRRWRVAEFYPETQWQRCVVHWYRNAFSHVPTSKVRELSFMLKAIHAQESRAAVKAKATEVAPSSKPCALPR